MPKSIFWYPSKWSRSRGSALSPLYATSRSLALPHLSSSRSVCISCSTDPVLPRWFVTILAPLFSSALSHVVFKWPGNISDQLGMPISVNSYMDRVGKLGRFSHIELTLSEKIYTPDTVTFSHNSTSNNAFFFFFIILKTWALNYVLSNSSRCVWTVLKSPQMLSAQA